VFPVLSKEFIAAVLRLAAALMSLFLLAVPFKGVRAPILVPLILIGVLVYSLSG
jgi:hypothetical protein